MKIFAFKLISFVLVTLLVACGGGSATTPNDSHALPVASAGGDRNVLVGETITLDGSNSSSPNGEVLTFAWVLLSSPEGSVTTLINPTTVRPKFVFDVEGQYVFALTVIDRSGESVQSLVKINASISNAAPVAHAGTEQTVGVGSLVSLDGSASNDANNDLLIYSWTFLSLPAGSSATLSNSAIVSPKFIAHLEGTYVLSLIVSDGKSSSESSIVTITATHANVSPVANAGIDQIVTLGDTVALDGSASSDADSSVLTYSWEFILKPSGSTTNLSDNGSISPTFTPDIAGEYLLQLVVNDGISNIADTIFILANEAAIVVGDLPGPYRVEGDDDFDGIGDSIYRTNTYNNKEQLISEAWDTGQETGQLLYQYDDSGNQIATIWDYNLNGVLDQDGFEHKKTYNYIGNINNFIVLAEYDFGDIYERDTTTWSSDSNYTTTLTFDENKKLIKRVAESDDGTIFENITYEYNNKGLLESSVNIGSRHTRKIYTYSYNSDGSLITMTEEVFDDNYLPISILDQKDIYTYNSEGKIIRRDSHDVNTGEIIRYTTYFYDSNSRLEKINNYGISSSYSTWSTLYKFH